MSDLSKYRLGKSLRERSAVDCTTGRVALHLDNGVTIVSGSESKEYIAGNWVAVFNAEGKEIGYWDAREWEEDCVQVMGAILNCAARGLSADELKVTE
jgi:hypothetical protein